MTSRNGEQNEQKTYKGSGKHPKNYTEIYCDLTKWGFKTLTYCVPRETARNWPFRRNRYILIGDKLKGQKDK